MNTEDLPEDSDSSDEDYVPEVKSENIPSEEDSDGIPEDALSESEEAPKGKGQKRKKNTTKRKKKVKTNTEETELTKEKSDEASKEDKKSVDDLWADFMKDTGFRPKNSRTDNDASKSTTVEKTKNTSQNKEPNNSQPSQKPADKVKITQIFEFAGEEVKVEKEVAANSAEARLLNKTTGSSKNVRKSGGLSGIGSVLSQLGKKQKISTLEKSKLDWDRFKKDENLEEELETYNKGKDGYLERQDFLQRADLRRFEIEKDIRNTERNKRFNSTL